MSERELWDRTCDICDEPIEPGQAHVIESQPGDKDGEACSDCYAILVAEAL